MWPFLIAAILLGGLLLYWLLVTTEGTYLGARIVALMYNSFARRYDRVKGFDPKYESFFLSRPMLSALQGRSKPLVLDVATGTGRVPLLLLAEESFSGRVVGLDYALKMLEVAAQKAGCHEDRVVWLWQNAMHLPFPNSSFDMVACLEALEFMPRPKEVLLEVVRVARPGTRVFLTRRRGWESRFMPGKTWSKPAFVELLFQAGLTDVKISPWQADYDLVWGTKTGKLEWTLDSESDWLLDLLSCPHCNGRKAAFQRTEKGLHCTICNIYYSMTNIGIIELARGKAV